MLRIVTDSSVDLPPEAVRDLAVTVVPLSIHFGNRTYIDGEDIDAATFYRMLQTEPLHPRTAQPPVGRFEEAFRSLAAEGHEVIAITLASDLSGTYNSAALAAESVPQAHVTLIDSRTASMATGAMVIRAARLAQQGCPLAELVATVQAMIPRLTIYLVVDTLTYLQRGGRIGRASSLVGTMLSVKPILTVRDGVVAPAARVRTHSKALQEVVKLVAAQAPIEEMYVMHAAAPQEAAGLASTLRPLYGDRDVPILALGPVVGMHVGPGALGVVTLRSSQSSVVSSQ